MDYAEKELLTGMCNCYETCREDFEGTVRMVARARNLTEDEVRSRLSSIKERYGSTSEYSELRARLPKAFPL
jgi:hypothetical protein